MNKKGFTLIELLAVIALLGILAVIAVPAIENALDNGRKKLDLTQEKQIIKGAKEFFAENIYCVPGSPNINKCEYVYNDCVREYSSYEHSVTLQCLKDEGYLPLSVVKILDEEEYDGSSTEGTTAVRITKVGENYNYELIEEY